MCGDVDGCILCVRVHAPRHAPCVCVWCVYVCGVCVCVCVWCVCVYVVCVCVCVCVCVYDLQVVCVFTDLQVCVCVCVCVLRISLFIDRYLGLPVMIGPRRLLTSYTLMHCRCGTPQQGIPWCWKSTRARWMVPRNLRKWSSWSVCPTLTSSSGYFIVKRGWGRGAGSPLGHKHVPWVIIILHCKGGVGWGWGGGAGSPLGHKHVLMSNHYTSL